MRTTRLRRLAWLSSVLAGGVCFQIAGCSLAGLRSYASSFNPCGTILNCDPVQYRFLTSGYEGPGVDPEVDPACTFPPFCAVDPFVGGAQP